MRFVCGDMRDHIVSYQNDLRPSYWRRRALGQQARLRIDFSEILRVVRFSTFATISANNGQNDRTALLVSISIERVSVCCLLVLGVGESRFEHFANRLPRAAVELN